MKGLDPMPSVDNNGSFDELLGSPIPAAEKESLSALLNDGGETPEQARIRELEAKLNAFAEKEKLAEKSADEKEKEHRAAVSATSSFNAAADSFEEVKEGDPDVITFHILESGLTFAGKVWWIGQTVNIKRGGKVWQESLDRNGNTWLADLSPAAQYKQFRKQVVGIGPWPGPAFDDAISKQDATRGNAAPVVNL
jgi:hypothetical protein